MAAPRVVLVMLRQPRMSSANERRSDPFWEFGSFGCTGCHRKNLLSPRTGSTLHGTRLGFVQGGNGLIKLVFVTPPVEVYPRGLLREVRWLPCEMPLSFTAAPIIIDNHGHSDFPEILGELDDVRRSTPVARFASKFRSRTAPLDVTAANAIIRGFEAAYRRSEARAVNYEDAMPHPPPNVDRDRAGTYRRLRQELGDFIPEGSD